MRTGTAAAATEENMIVCFLFMPPIKSMKSVTIPKHIVTLMLGSMMTRKQNNPATQIGGKRPLKVLILS